MEKKLMEKIDKATVELNDKINTFHEEVKKFFKDAFGNEDLLKMVDTINDAKYKGYSYKIGNYYLTINERRVVALRYDDRYDACVVTTFNVCMPTKNYSDKYIDHLKGRAQELVKEQKWFKQIVEETPNIIEDITTQYKNIVERQSDTLDEIFNMLDVQEEPTKHIKVTVEWI